MAQLPQFQDGGGSFQMMQNRWAAILNPVISKAEQPKNNTVILRNVSLLSASNPNVVNHGLNREVGGWKIIRQRASAIIWDTQDSNPNPNVSLYLRTSADVTIDLEVF